MKIRNNIIFFLSAFILLYGCNSNNNKEKEFVDEETIENCIKEIVNPDPKSIDSTYLINPYLGSFSFNKYTANNYSIDEYTYRNKKKVLEKIGLTEENFRNEQKEIDSICLNKYFPNLENLSKGNKSHRLITFSGASERLVFVEVITYCEVINKNDLSKDNVYFSKNEIKDISSLAIIIENKKVKEITVDNGIVFEKQCEVTK